MALVLISLASAAHAEVVYLTCDVGPLDRSKPPDQQKLTNSISLEIDTAAGTVRTGSLPCPMFKIDIEIATSILFKGCGTIEGNIDRVSGEISLSPPFVDGKPTDDWWIIGICKPAKKLF